LNLRISLICAPDGDWLRSRFAKSLPQHSTARGHSGTLARAVAVSDAID